MQTNQNIAHRDIKPENIMVEDIDKLDIKITDFGFSKIIEKENIQEETKKSW